MLTLRTAKLLVVGALGLLLAVTTACNPTPNGSTPRRSAGNIEITYTLQGVTHEESFPAGSDGQRDYRLTPAVALGATASITADQTSAGFLSCLITYVSPLNDQLYIIDYARDPKPGSVTCRSDHGKIADTLQHMKGKKIPPGQPADCCKPDTLTLNVTWLKR